MPANAILLSVHPRYVREILSGNKTVELRRKKPKHIEKGTLVLLYATAPVKAVVGAFTVDGVAVAHPDQMWNDIRLRAAVSRKDYETYFSGSSQAVAISIGAVWCLHEPLKLDQVRKRIGGFRPPQGFCYAGAKSENQRPKGVGSLTVDFLRGHSPFRVSIRNSARTGSRL